MEKFTQMCIVVGTLYCGVPHIEAHDKENILYHRNQSHVGVGIIKPSPVFILRQVLLQAWNLQDKPPLIVFRNRNYTLIPTQTPMYENKKMEKWVEVTTIKKTGFLKFTK